ncbi:MAG: DUF3572 domain-containing protein [Marinibacterium sp.]|nr:DUF3572 domain-containing protein [Marinibacterium sp.]
MTPLSPDRAETLALQVLAWVLGNDDLLPVFMGSTGAHEGDLRARAGDPVFLAAVLDFLLMDDAWVMGFCQSVGAEFDLPMRARAGLPGGDVIHWT